MGIAIIICLGVILTVVSLCLFISDTSTSNAENIVNYICDCKIQKEKIKANKEITIAQMQLENEIKLRKWLDEPLQK